MLTEVLINGPLTVLPDCTFTQVTSLTRVTLPDTITAIGEAAFSECGLQTLTLPAQLKTIGESAFSLFASLESLVLPEGMETLEVNAIVACEKLKTVTLPASVKSIGDGDFFNCCSMELRAPEGSYVWNWAK